MPVRQLGTVSREAQRYPNLIRHRFRWITDASGDATLPDVDLLGSGYLAISRHSSSGSGTYTVTLQDDLERDWLASLLATLTINTTSSKQLHDALTDGAAKWSRPLLFCGVYDFVVTHTIAAINQGVTDIFVVPP